MRTRIDMVCPQCGSIMDQSVCRVKCVKCNYFEDCEVGGINTLNYDNLEWRMINGL